MLKLSLTQGEYLTIGDGIVVQLCRTEGGRAYLAVKAPREVPIVRGTVSDRNGAARPEGLMRTPPKGQPSLGPI